MRKLQEEQRAHGTKWVFQHARRVLILHLHVVKKNHNRKKLDLLKDLHPRRCKAQKKPDFSHAFIFNGAVIRPASYTPVF